MTNVVRPCASAGGVSRAAVRGPAAGARAGSGDEELAGERAAPGGQHRGRRLLAEVETAPGVDPGRDACDLLAGHPCGVGVLGSRIEAAVGPVRNRDGRDEAVFEGLGESASGVRHSRRAGPPARAG